MKRIRLSLLLTFVGFTLLLSSSLVWASYGAGNTAQVPATSQGMTAQVTSSYTAAPALSQIGLPVTLTTDVTNPTGQSSTVSAYFRVYKITQAPNGTNVTDGGANIDESTLFSYYANANLVSTLLNSSTFAPTQVPAGTQITLSADLTPLDPGYYQFVFSTVNADVDPASGQLLSTGFIRVVSGSTPSPSAQPTPTSTPVVTASPMPSPSVTPTPIPSPVNSGYQSVLALSTPTCSNKNTTVTLRLLLNGIGQSGKSVSFTYAGETKSVLTDASGDAVAVFGFKYGAVKAIPADNFPSQSGTITQPAGCPAEPVEELMGGIKSTHSGQVLGAYADTGLSKTDLFAFALFGALAFMAVGLFLYGASLVL